MFYTSPPFNIKTVLASSASTLKPAKPEKPVMPQTSQSNNIPNLPQLDSVGFPTIKALSKDVNITITHKDVITTPCVQPTACPDPQIPDERPRSAPRCIIRIKSKLSSRTYLELKSINDRLDEIERIQKIATKFDEGVLKFLKKIQKRDKRKVARDMKSKDSRLERRAKRRGRKIAKRIMKELVLTPPGSTPSAQTPSASKPPAPMLSAHMHSQESYPCPHTNPPRRPWTKNLKYEVYPPPFSRSLKDRLKMLEEPRIPRMVYNAPSKLRPLKAEDFFW